MSTSGISPAGESMKAKTARRYAISRTVSFIDQMPDVPGIEQYNEVGYLNRRVERAPRRLQPFAQRWYELQFALHLLRHARRYDAFAIGRYGVWFPLLYRALGGKAPIVMTDTEWKSHSTGRMNRLVGSRVNAIQAFTDHELEGYVRAFRVPREKFVRLPLTFQSADLRPAADEGYVFAGGQQGRDWETLLRAVDGLPYPVRIFTGNALKSALPNVEIRSVSRDEFYHAMARAGCVVVSTREEPTRVTGTTTWTNAMAMGKVVIATDPSGAADYMVHGREGFYCARGDHAALRAEIDRVMHDAELRRQVGQAARERAWADFSPQAFRAKVIALLDRLVDEAHGAAR